MKPWSWWKRSFGVWEKASTALAHQWLYSPVVLEPTGAWLSAAMRMKVMTDRARAAWIGALGLPTKRDQERTLHALNELQSKLLDLQEQLEDRA